MCFKYTQNSCIFHLIRRRYYVIIRKAHHARTWLSLDVAIIVSSCALFRVRGGKDERER